MKVPHIQVDGIEYIPAQTSPAHVPATSSCGTPWLANERLWPTSRAHAAWSEATSSDGHRQCRHCGAFVRDNGDLDRHCCLGHDED